MGKERIKTKMNEIGEEFLDEIEKVVKKMTSKILEFAKEEAENQVGEMFEKRRKKSGQ